MRGFMNRFSRGARLVQCLAVATLLVAGCQSDPQKVDVVVKETPPAPKITSFSRSLADLGRMTEIFDKDPLKIMSNPIGDNTGAAVSTGSEIPSDITEMLKSTLNSIGGRVTYVPYDPVFVSNQQALGYSTFENKVIPDVVISGGITEFDRGLETREKGSDFGLEITAKNPPGWLPSPTAGIEYSDTEKQGLARITLDFNLLDFQTLSGIPRINAVNSMEVRKGLAEQELGIALFGPVFGRKGVVKKVQGRHHAIRLLVELSMIQIIGKYMKLPYWRLLGEEAEPDQLVLKAIQKAYYNLSEEGRVRVAQQWLFVWGYPTDINGKLDDKTVAALKKVNPKFSSSGSGIDYATFSELYINMPYDVAAAGRKHQLAGKTIQDRPREEPAAPRVAQPRPAAPSPAPAPKQAAAPAPAPKQAATAPAPKPEPQPAPQTAAKEQPAPAPAPAPKTAGAAPSRPAPAGGPVPAVGVGRMLKETEW